MWYSAEYATFYIANEASRYWLWVTGYSGDAGNALMVTAHGNKYTANGRRFSTRDSDSDGWGHINCAANFGSGWWFKTCSTSDINTHGYGLWTSGNPAYNVRASRMLVKLI